MQGLIDKWFIELGNAPVSAQDVLRINPLAFNTYTGAKPGLTAYFSLQYLPGFAQPTTHLINYLDLGTV